MRTRTTAILCALLRAPLLSSCGGGPRADESNDLWDAQFALAQVEEQMASRVPDGNVVDTRTSADSHHLSSCSSPKSNEGENEWKWTELKTIELTGYLDQQQFLREAEQEILSQDGWRREFWQYGDGEQTIHMEHEDGSALFLSFDSVSTAAFEVHAVTDCYYLPNYNYKDEFTFGR